MNRLIKYILLISPLVCGCSIVTLDRYYAPDLPIGETYRDTHCASLLIAGGAREVAILNNPLVSFEVRQIHQEVSLITAGPLYFALIPAFPIDWILPHDSPKDHLDLRITVTSLSNDLVWNLQSMKMIFPDGREIIPTVYDEENRYYSNPKDPSIPLTVSGKLWIWEKKPPPLIGYSFLVRYTLDINSNKSFKLDPGYINVGSEKISFPQIAFAWSKGWSYCFVP